MTAKLNNSLKMRKAVRMVQTIVKIFLAVQNFQKRLQLILVFAIIQDYLILGSFSRFCE